MVDLPNITAFSCPAEHGFIRFAESEAVVKQLIRGLTVLSIECDGNGSIKIETGL